MAMTQREIDICKDLLQSLHNLDGSPAGETLLHAAVNERLENRGRLPASLTEFDAARKHADAQGWLIGQPAITGKMKWTISDKGRSALPQL